MSRRNCHPPQHENRKVIGRPSAVRRDLGDRNELLPCILRSIQTAGLTFGLIRQHFNVLGAGVATQYPTEGAAWEGAIELAIEDALKEVLR